MDLRVRRIAFVALFLAIFTYSFTWARAGLGWVSYEDAGLDMTFSHPSDWILLPRSAAPDTVGQLVTVTGPELDDGFHCSVTIGQDMNEIRSERLLDWARKRMDMEKEVWGPSVHEELAVESELRIPGVSEVVRGEGQAQQSLFLRREGLVWFAHANFASGIDAACDEAFQGIGRSLRLGAASPRSYGDLVRLSRSAALQASAGIAAVSVTEPIRALFGKLSSSWYSPLHNNPSTNVPWTVNCGSTLHTMGSSFAADVAASYGSPVYAAQAGTVTTVGDSSTGFGKYVVINTNGQYHYYAHLSSIKSYIKKDYVVSRRGLLLGYVGNSGLGQPGTQGTHLHFHLQDGSSHTYSNGISLVGMTGFTSNSKYPSGSGACGTMGR